MGKSAYDMNIAVSVKPILATPLGIASIPDAQPLNAAVREVFALRMKAQGPPPREPLCYTGSEDLLDWPDEPVRRLAEAMVGSVGSVVSGVNGFTEPQMRALTMQARAWFTVLRTNGCVPQASYPLTAWCAIYCVAASPPVDTRSDSGVVRLYESRFGTTFHDVSSCAMGIPYTHSHYAWHPVAGQMAIFPGYLTHEIALSKAAGELIFVTLRCRFTAPGQPGLSRW